VIEFAVYLKIRYVRNSILSIALSFYYNIHIFTKL